MKSRISYLYKSLGLVYALYFVCRVVFFVFQYNKFAEVHTGEILKAFFVGTLFDTVSIFYSNILFIFFTALPINYLGRNYIRVALWGLYIVPNLLAVALNMIDVAYYDFSQRRTGDEIIFLIYNSSDVTGAYLKDYWHIVFLFLVCTACLIWGILRIPFPQYKIEGKVERLRAVAWFLLIMVVSLISMRGGFFRTPLLTPDAAKFIDAKLVGLATNTPHQVISTVQTVSMEVNHFMDMEVAEKIVSPYQHYPLENFKKKNVVVIILESFDKEYIGFYNNGVGYTPFLDSLIAEGISFQHSYANGSSSIECPPAILSSIPSLMDDSYINSQYNTNRLSGIGEILKEEGYSTGFYHGGENGTMNFDAFIGITNFGKYYGLMQYPSASHFDGNWGVPDELYLQYFAKQLDQSSQPFCNAVFTLSSHHPYFVPEAYKDILPSGTLPIHKSVAYADLSLRNFFRRVKKSKWYENTIFVITADHTSITDNPAYYSYFGDYGVPVVFFGDNIRPKVIRDRVIQHKDVMPSLFHLLGYNKPFFSMGRNVFDEGTRTFSVTYRNGTYSYFTYPYFLETNLTSFKVSNQRENMVVPEEVADSINTEFKAYLQVYQNRMVKNRLY